MNPQKFKICTVINLPLTSFYTFAPSNFFFPLLKCSSNEIMEKNDK